MVFFLKNSVVGRETRKKGKKGQTSDEPGAVRTVGIATLKAYTAAIVDLYESQKTCGMNSNPPPRGRSVKALLKTQKIDNVNKKRSEHAVRGTATYLDGYSTRDQLVSLSNYFLHRNCEEGLRDRLAFLLAHYGLLRGDNARRLELADLHTVVSENEGFTRCVAFLMTLDNGKTNHDGRIEYGSFIRAKEPEACAVGAMALYFFHRFMISEETFPGSDDNFPSFKAREDWYDLRVLRAPKSPTEPINYTTHLNAINKALQACGMNLKAKTHAMRGSACRMADIGGANEANIMRAGRWGSNTSMDSCYLTTLPRAVIRVLAGYPVEGRCFWLARGVLDPPQSLQVQVFPLVEEGLAEIEEDGNQDLAGMGFLKLLKELRVVLLKIRSS